MTGIHIYLGPLIDCPRFTAPVPFGIRERFARLRARHRRIDLRARSGVGKGCYPRAARGPVFLRGVTCYICKAAISIKTLKSS